MTLRPASLSAALCLLTACAAVVEPVAANNVPASVDEPSPPAHPLFNPAPVVSTPNLALDSQGAAPPAVPRGYVPAVTRDNQRRLGTHRSWAMYANGMHNRIHPVFAEGYLGKELGRLEKSDPLNNPKLFTRIEIILDKDGQLLAAGTVRSSGIVDFDLGALESVKRSAPFGRPPPEILSSDGQVYIHWEFHREEAIACSTLNTSPFRLEVPAAAR